MHRELQNLPAAPPAPVALSEPCLGGNEWRYLQECLETNFVSSVGPFVERFEREVAAYVGAKHAVAATSGTAALHLALLAAGIERDDEVVMPPLTFVATANAVRYVGAWPVFVDVDADYWQLDAAKVADFLDRECVWRNGRLENRTTGRRVRALLPVHILGHPCDMQPLQELTRRHELRLVEDATESLGARYRGQRVGTFGDVGCFSFNGNKIVTCGGGGMIVTDNEALAARARYLSTQARDDAIESIHHEIGFNYRLTNVQAAIGCAQLEQIDGFIAARRRVAAEYRRGLAGVDGIVPMKAAPWAESIDWLFTVTVDAARYGIDSRALMRRLAELRIQSRPLWCALHRLRPYAGAQTYRLEHVERIIRDALSLPSSASLPLAAVSSIAAAIAACRAAGADA